MIERPFLLPKIEYDSYLRYLIDEESTNTEKIVEKPYVNLKHHVEQMDEGICSLNESCKSMLKKNLDLEKEIEKEEAFRAEKSAFRTIPNDAIAKMDLEDSGGGPKKLTFKEKVEMKRISILKNVQEINKYQDNLKANFVPSVVIGNLNQTIKDIEVASDRMRVHFLIIPTKKSCFFSY
jgi:hypothetical protein